jgi:DNA-binding LacI/PurR family transcriptional regulator
LIDLGHRRIAVLCGDADNVSVALRTLGCRKAFDSNEIPYSNTPFLPGIYSDTSGYNRIREYLRETPTAEWPTALLCYSDYIAHGALLALSEMGIRCPQQMSVIGVDDAHASESTNPPLTTMRMPLKDLGRRAVDILLRLINSKTGSSVQTHLPAELVVRQSTAPPRANNS